MYRQIVLDTETTGISTADGHRIIEIACVEMINRKLTGAHFHHYINPCRLIEAEAQAVHGISAAFLKDKPYFEVIAEEFIAFVKDAELIIHNAPFDIGFINYELRLLRHPCKNIVDYCKIIDTLPMARQLHVGQKNNLDALCKRYSVDNSKRELHGALLDAHLLAQVYLAMTGGQGSFFDDLNEQSGTKLSNSSVAATLSSRQLLVLKTSTEEDALHQAYLEKMQSLGKCLWADKN